MVNKKAAGSKKGKSAPKKGGVVTDNNYVAKATLRNLRMSPRKARLVVNLIKGKQIEPALQILTFSSKKAAGFTEKLLRSAIQSAVENASADADRLWITDAWVNMGRTMKRYMPRAQGRATPIRKRSSHITICLSQRG